MKKRLLPVLLALALTVAMFPAAHALQAGEAEMAQVLAALDIMTGDQYGNLMLERNVTRAEFTKLVIAASPYGENVGASTTVSPYPDVPYTDWAAPYVEAAVAAGLVKGNLYGYFEPGREITLQEGVTMVVRLLGYADTDFSGAWPSGQLTLYRNLDLDEGISLSPTDPMTRRDAMKLFYNLLTAQTKTGQTYLLTLGHTLTAAGEIDRVALINSAMNGPVVMGTGWQSKVNFPVSTATVYRGGNLTSLTALQPGDVIYWSKSMRTLWAYSSKVTGLYQSASPSASSPSVVVVAGRTYPIETAEAAYDLSNLGQFKTGDTVTLLLGRDGGVAAVTTPSAAVTGTLVGVVTAVGDQSYNDANNSRYTAKTVVLTATDGNTYTYPVEAKSTFKAGELVQVTASGGETEVKRLSGTSVWGKVNAAATMLGNTTPLSSDIEILDVDKNGSAVKLYASRLAGMTLESGHVKYYRKNADGEIDVLILNDATGDLGSYGVLTSVNEQSAGMILMGSYVYDVGGVSYPYVLSNGILNLSVGPVKIEGNLAAPDTIKKLTSVKLSSVDAGSAVTEDNAAFPVWENVAVYELENNTYRLSSLERVRTGYTLTGWYDKEASKGGRIRVIVARAQ